MNGNDRIKTHTKTELFVFDHLTGELEIVEVKDAGSAQELIDPKARADSSVKMNDEVVTLNILPVRC